MSLTIKEYTSTLWSKIKSYISSQLSVYYTKTEANKLLSGKSDTSHNHNSAYLGIKG